MFTPQEIQERSDSLEKAVFGGYSMSSVEELFDAFGTGLCFLVQRKCRAEKQNESIGGTAGGIP